MIRVLDIPVCESRRKAGKSAFESSSQNIDSPREKKSSEVLPRKASKWYLDKTVPQTDTGGRVEYTKALERTREKELGKLTP